MKHQDTGLIPWTIMVSPEFITEQGGISLRQWTTSPAAKIEAIAETEEILEKEFGLNPLGDSVSTGTPSYLTLKIIGNAEIVMPEDHYFMVRGTVLNSIHEIGKLKIPDSIIDHPEMAPYREQYRWLVDHVDKRLSVGMGPGTQGPVTMAKLLRGQDFFADLVEFPDEAHRLLEIVTDTIIKAWSEVREFLNQPLTGTDIAIHDDFAGLMGPNHYRQFAVPCYQRIYEAFSPKRRLFHSELLREGHLRYLGEMRVDYLNLGENQYMRPRDVSKVTDVPFEWHVKTATVRDGTPEMIRKEYDDAVADGAPAMLTELCAREIPFENIHAFIRAAGRHGPFVSPGNCYRAAMWADEQR